MPWINNKRARLALKILVSAALLSMLLWLVNPREAAGSIAAADKGLLAIALAVAFANRLLMAVKWNVLARAIGVRIPWLTAANVYIASTFAGVFLPPTIGGDAVRTVMLSRRYGRTAEIISSIIVERVLGLLVLAFFGLLAVSILAILFAEEVPAAASIAQVIGATAVALCVAVILLTRPSFYRLVQRIIERLQRKGGIWSRHAGLAEKIRISCETFNRRPVATAGFSLLTVLENLLAIGRGWLVAVAFGVTIDPLLFFVVVPIENFVARLPVSFDGFGLREGLFLYVLSTFGVPPATALAIGLTNHLIFIFAVLPGAWLLATGWKSLTPPGQDKPPVRATTD